MANTLVIAEMLDGHVRKSTHSAITFARNVGAPFTILVMGQGAKAAAAEIATYGAAKVITVDDAYLANQVAERFAPTIAEIAKSGGFDVVVVTASSFGKDVAPRVAAKLGAGYAPDINGVKADGGTINLRVTLPAVVSVDLRIVAPKSVKSKHTPDTHTYAEGVRFAALMAIMAAKKKPLVEMKLAELASDTALKIKYTGFELPPARKAGIKVKTVAELVEKLKTEAGVL